MEDDLLILFLVQCHRLVDFATLLDKNLIYLQLNGLSLDDLLFDGVLCHESVDIDVLPLANPMRSIHCL